MSSAAVLLILVAPVLLVLVVVVVAVAFRRRIQTMMFPGAGFQEWADTARGLTLRERWTVVRVNSRGRPAPADLAEAAVQRGRLAAGMGDRLLTKGSGVRRFWLGMAVFWALALAVAIATVVLADPPRWSHWTQVVSAAYWLGAIWYFVGPPQRRVRERLLRSVRLNEELLADQDPGVSRR